jgi:hypothetical protein
LKGTRGRERMRMTCCSAVAVALLLVLGGGGVHAQVAGAAVSQLPPVVLGPTPDPVPGDDTLRAKIKACLLAGEMKCVVDNYLLLKDIGRAPEWLVVFQNAFAVVNRRAGECKRVAEAIHEGLRQLGQTSQFVRFTSKGDGLQVIGFDEVAEGTVIRTYQVASNGTHWAVRFHDKIIDAYTGLKGLPLEEYLRRLQPAPGNQIVYEVVDSL